ncbi:hypothetical protein K438DRAFT_1976578 [Mycena galopus ATCC 62051]|nr:hypothetical protein K438DRAFT_1976578 [Mycena galopus ATCC 62051]
MQGSWQSSAQIGVECSKAGVKYKFVPAGSHRVAGRTVISARVDPAHLSCRSSISRPSPSLPLLSVTPAHRVTSARDAYPSPKPVIVCVHQNTATSRLLTAPHAARCPLETSTPTPPAPSNATSLPRNSHVTSLGANVTAHRLYYSRCLLTNRAAASNRSLEIRIHAPTAAAASRRLYYRQFQQRFHARHTRPHDG